MRQRQESIDLLNSTHEFPCVFTFKIIGKASEDFVCRVVSVLAEFTTNDQLEHSIRETPGGRHIAITAEPTIEEAAHVLAAYDRLKAIDGVIMLL